MDLEKENHEIWIISDTHLISQDLHDNGAAFIKMKKTSVGKDLDYQEIALKSFAKMAQEKTPDAIVVTGDVTFNGELKSAQKFAQIFSSLTKTKLLVVPGNHDIYDGWAREFRGEQQFYTPETSPEDWKAIFKTSYKDAVSQDPSSLAYSVKLGNYYLIMLDSNYYGHQEAKGAPLTQGEIGDKQLSWLKEELESSKNAGLYPILFMHHNLYAHNPAVNKNFVLDDAEKLRKLCEEYDVRLAFSGHIHAQNILEPQDSTPTTEIVTGSFCSNDQPYGVLDLYPNYCEYHKYAFDMKPYLSEEEKKNNILKNFHTYLENLQWSSFTSGSVNNKLLARLSINYFTGNNHLDQTEFEKMKQSPDFKEIMQMNPQLRFYAQTLYDTSDHSNIYAKIDFR